MELLDKFPVEGGQKDPKRRIIPFLPGRVKHTLSPRPLHTHTHTHTRTHTHTHTHAHANTHTHAHTHTHTQARKHTQSWEISIKNTKTFQRVWVIFDFRNWYFSLCCEISKTQEQWPRGWRLCSGSLCCCVRKSFRLLWLVCQKHWLPSVDSNDSVMDVNELEESILFCMHSSSNWS